jgi:hypothetical protein
MESGFRHDRWVGRLRRAANWKAAEGFSGAGDKVGHSDEDQRASRLAPEDRKEALMLAKLVLADIDPRRVDDAARAVEQELIPFFVAHPGARRGYWMANRTTGHMLVMTGWSDADSLEAASAADGTQRTRVAERLGIRIRAIQTLDVLAFQDTDDADKPVIRWARATWVEGVSPDLDASVQAMHRELLPAQTRARGFCASYWLADRRTGNGLALSLWNGPTELRDDETDSKRRRRRFEQAVGRKIYRVREYEALGVTAPSTDRRLERIHGGRA